MSAHLYPVLGHTNERDPQNFPLRTSSESRHSEYEMIGHLIFLAQIGVLEITEEENKLIYNFNFIIFSFQQNMLGTLLHRLKECILSH